MSYVIAAPDSVALAAHQLASMGSAIVGANAATLAPTTQLLAAGADEVSTAVASLFGLHGQEYQAVIARVTSFHEQLVQALSAREPVRRNRGRQRSGRRQPVAGPAAASAQRDQHADRDAVGACADRQRHACSAATAAPAATVPKVIRLLAVLPTTPAATAVLQASSATAAPREPAVRRPSPPRLRMGQRRHPVRTRRSRRCGRTISFGNGGRGRCEAAMPKASTATAGRAGTPAQVTPEVVTVAGAVTVASSGQRGQGWRRRFRHQPQDSPRRQRRDRRRRGAAARYS